MTEIIERLMNELEIACLEAERDAAWQKLRAELAAWKKRCESGEKGEPFFLAPNDEDAEHERQVMFNNGEIPNTPGGCVTSPKDA